MSLTINIDRFTRLKQSISGKFAPHALPRLAEYLAAEDGEISYSLAGNLVVDQTGSQERRVKCIIYGWFLLFDPVTLAPVRHELSIDSSLILVKDESELPPLETESETEDYIVCGTEMDVSERIEEEVLLDLPAQAIDRSGLIDSRGKRSGGVGTKVLKTTKTPEVFAADSKKISPFAKLAKLKMK